MSDRLPKLRARKMAAKCLIGRGGRSAQRRQRLMPLGYDVCCLFEKYAKPGAEAHPPPGFSFARRRAEDEVNQSQHGRRAPLQTRHRGAKARARGKISMRSSSAPARRAAKELDLPPATIPTASTVVLTGLKSIRMSESHGFGWAKEENDERCENVLYRRWPNPAMECLPIVFVSRRLARGKRYLRLLGDGATLFSARLLQSLRFVGSRWRGCRGESNVEISDQPRSLRFLIENGKLIRHGFERRSGEMAHEKEIHHHRYTVWSCLATKDVIRPAVGKLFPWIEPISASRSTKGNAHGDAQKNHQARAEGIFFVETLVGPPKNISGRPSNGHQAAWSRIHQIIARGLR